jgi:hypothetical protein
MRSADCGATGRPELLVDPLELLERLAALVPPPRVKAPLPMAPCGIRPDPG